MKRLMILGIVMMAAPAVSVQMSNPNVSEALGQWESLAFDASVQEIEACAEAALREARYGDRETIDRLLRIMQKDDVTLWSAKKAMDVACETADAQGAQHIIDTVNSIRANWSTEDFATQEEATRASERYMGAAGALVDRGAEHLLQVLEDHGALFEFLNWHYQGTLFDNAAAIKCAQLMAACDVPPAVKEKAIVAIILAPGKPFKGSTFYFLFDYLTPASFPALRKGVRTEAAEGRFHSPAFFALAYLGDREMEPDLEVARTVIDETGGNSDTYVQQLRWLIDARHDPTLYMKVVAGENAPGRVISRNDAIRIAARLGIDKARIKDAIMKYAAPLSVSERRLFLPGLKREGLRLGILEETDFPDVELPSRHATVD